MASGPLLRRSPASRATTQGRRSAVLAATLGLVLTVAACGADPVDTAAPSTSTAATPATATATATAEPSSTEPPSTEPSVSAPAVEPSDAGPSSAPASGPATAAGATITVDDFAYDVSGTVEPGATVTVVNDDVETHTVTSSPPGAFGISVGVGETATFVAPAESGEYRFVCLLHGGMEAVVVVG